MDGHLKEEDIHKALEKGITVKQGIPDFPDIYQEADQIIAALARYEIGTQPDSLYRLIDVSDKYEINKVRS